MFGFNGFTLICSGHQRGNEKTSEVARITRVVRGGGEPTEDPLSGVQGRR